MIEIGEDSDRRARRHDFAGVEQALCHDAANRRRDGGITFGFLERCNLSVDGCDARAGGLDFLAPRSRAEPCDPFARACDARPRGRHAISRHVPSSRRIVALFLGAGIALQQRLEALKIRLGGGEVGLRGGDVGRRGGDLRLGLADVLTARAGLQQPQLRVRLRSLGLRALQREIDVARVEPRHHIALLHAIAFGNRHLDDAPADFGRHLHFSRVDLPGHARACRGRGFLTSTDATAATTQRANFIVFINLSSVSTPRLHDSHDSSTLDTSILLATICK